MASHRRYAAILAAVAIAVNCLALYLNAWGTLPVVLSFAAACFAFSWSIAAREKPQALSESAAEGRALIKTSLRCAETQRLPSTPLNAFTIDLEDYFHTEVASRSVQYEEWDSMPSRIESSVHRLLDILDDNQTRATVFVLGWVARKHPRLVREVAHRGHEIACHSFRHRRVNQLTPAAFHEDTRMAREILEDVTGAAVEGYRAPSFSITPGTEWAFDILEQLGFSYDSSVNPIWHAAYANPHAPRFPYFQSGARILEIPIATWRVGKTNLPVGGGAYLRLLPYSYIRRGLAVINRRELQPATIYVHPWEIDYFQPSIHTGWASHARQMWGTRGMEAKLRSLLASARFATISEVYAQSLPPVAPLFRPLPQSIPSFVQAS